MSNQRAEPARPVTGKKQMVVGLLAGPEGNAARSPRLLLAGLAGQLDGRGGDALSAALENNAAVREAAYGYHPDERIESERHRR